MQTMLKPADFIKVKRFIDNETNGYKSKDPIIKELSSTELYVGECRIVKTKESWQVEHQTNNIPFNTKRNAMYYAFLVAFKNTKMIPELLDIDNKIGNTQAEIIRLKYILDSKDIKQDSWKTGLYHNKLSEAVARYQKVKNDMHNWMHYAKYIN